MGDDRDQSLCTVMSSNYPLITAQVPVSTCVFLHGHTCAFMIDSTEKFSKGKKKKSPISVSRVALVLIILLCGNNIMIMFQVT